MKLGVGLYRYMLKDEEFTFARQCGCSDVIIHLANYYDGENDIVKATDEKENYGIARAGESVWSLDHMMALQKQAKEKGLNIYGIENFSPADWYDTVSYTHLDVYKRQALGLTAFIFGTIGGVLLGKLLCKITGGKINPLIGSAGVSAVPMAARVSQKVGAEADPTNFLLMHAMGPNVAGVIGTAVAAGTFMAIFGV